MSKLLLCGFFFLFLLSCAHSQKLPLDPYQWLEDVESESALAWVKTQNEITKNHLEKNKNYLPLFASLKTIFNAKDRIAYVTLDDKNVYHFYQTEENPKGIYRKASLSTYLAKKPNWETILDIDQLSKNELENWVWKGIRCLPSDTTICFLRLSRGGKDAVVLREFNVKTKSFVKGGFELPEAKTQASWLDKDHILLATNFGPNTMTDSGYARQVRLWKRGTLHTKAQLLLEADKQAVSAYGHSVYHPIKNLNILETHPSFYESEFFIYNIGQPLVKINVPKETVFAGLVGDQVLFELKTDMKWKDKIIQKGTLFSVDRGPLEESGSLENLKAVFVPKPTQSIVSADTSANSLIVTYLDTVRGQIGKWTYINKQWVESKLPLPKSGMTALVSTEFKSDRVLVEFTDFITPSQVWYFDQSLNKKKVAELPARFNATNLVVEQKFAVSKDGTKIPYSIVKNKTIKKGPQPTVLYGYGGFEISITPNYLAAKGKAWLERGGVYVVANIRGGGEFGPNWHQAALKANRQKAYDDFIAVAEALINDGVTSNQKLAIEGYSNGGLLVGAVAMQRPDLFKAVICGVPLLDMMRFHKLLAGASWMAEYGNPDTADRKFMLKYSPYQNVKAGVKYPAIFFLTSTKDDRVHPGHARKMAAKLLGFGAPVTYFENIDGGHSAAADLEWKAKLEAYKAVFLTEQLF